MKKSEYKSSGLKIFLVELLNVKHVKELAIEFMEVSIKTEVHIYLFALSAHMC